MLTYSLWLDACALALFDGVEPVEVALAAAVPEARTAAVCHVKVPAHSEVAARASIFLVATHL